MATPADVVAGEVIEVEWGNSVRDFACFGVEFGGAMDAVGGSMTTTFATVCTVTFTKPADWVNYKIMVWGSLEAQYPGGTGTAGEVRFQVDGVNGTAVAYGALAAEQTATWLAMQTATFETAASCVINLQARETAEQIVVGPSQINFVAYRTS